MILKGVQYLKPQKNLYWATLSGPFIKHTPYMLILKQTFILQTPL